MSNSTPPAATSTDSLSLGISSYPISYFIFGDKFSLYHKDFLAAITTNIKHTQFSEALPIPHWRDAMRSEITILERNQTWDLTSSWKKGLGV